MVLSMPLSAYAKDVTDSGGSTELTVEVPATQRVEISIIGNGDVLINGESGVTDIERQSSVTIKPVCEDGNIIQSLIVNGVDVTDKLVDGGYTLDRVHEDISIEVTFKIDENYSSSESSSNESSATDSSSSKTDTSSSSKAQNNANTVSPDTGIALSISGGAVLCAAALIAVSGRKKKDK